MKRVTGIGGISLNANDLRRYCRAWYDNARAADSLNAFASSLATEPQPR